MIALHYFLCMAASADLGAEIIIHLARLAQSGANAQRLTPAQWTALRFFARANRLSRTPSAFSAFHATTRGTASQTVRSLVALGLLERHRSESDGRSIRYELTEEGHAALADDPLKALSERLEQLPAAERTQLLSALQGIAGDLAQSRDATVFGTCSDCSHCDPGEDRPAYCHCAAQTLLDTDMDALCVEFQPRRPATNASDSAG